MRTLLLAAALLTMSLAFVPAADAYQGHKDSNNQGAIGDATQFVADECNYSNQFLYEGAPATGFVDVAACYATGSGC